jgi:hypothetical protein
MRAERPCVHMSKTSFPSFRSPDVYLSYLLRWANTGETCHILDGLHTCYSHCIRCHQCAIVYMCVCARACEFSTSTRPSKLYAEGCVKTHKEFDPNYFFANLK